MTQDSKNVNIKNFTKSRYFAMLPYLQNEKTKKLTSIILTLTFVAIFGIFAISPTVSTIIKLKKELADKQSIEKSLQEKIKNLSILQERYAEIGVDIPYVLDAIPDKPQVALLMSQIQSIARDTNITISNLQNLAVELFSQNIGGEQHFSYSFSVSGTGSFQNIIAFLSQLVNMQRIINVDTLSIDKAAEGVGGLKFSLQGEALYKP